MPPETTTPTGPLPARPARTAATATAPAGSQASFARHVEEPERVLDLLLGDEHALDFVRLQHGERRLARERAGEPVGDRVRRHGHGPSGRERIVHRRRALRLDRDDAPVGRRGGDSGDEAAAARRHEDRLDLGRVLEQLERQGALAGDHERVVERVHERPARLADVLVEPGERLDRVGGLEVDGGAVPRVAATFAALALAYMTTRQSIPSAAAPQASACAWLPAEIPITPRAFSSALSEASLLRTPRALKEPVFWKSSAFSQTCSPSVREEKVGVRWTRPRIRSAAASTSSRAHRHRSIVDSSPWTTIPCGSRSTTTSAARG